MPQPKATGAYLDCEAHFASALESSHGIAIVLESPGLATRFKAKMNSYRELLRKKSKSVHDPADERYGTSIYDKFQLTSDPDNPCRVLIRPYHIVVKAVEKLGPPEG